MGPESHATGVHFYAHLSQRGLRFAMIPARESPIAQATRFAASLHYLLQA